uniref:Uncharacterized protein n=1 Tax=Rhizophora mucronata TaxID=61149 RepID=A0A2P2NAJ9_RHIMU
MFLIFSFMYFYGFFMLICCRCLSRVFEIVIYGIAAMSIWNFLLINLLLSCH